VCAYTHVYTLIFRMYIQIGVHVNIGTCDLSQYWPCVHTNVYILVCLYVYVRMYMLISYRYIYVGVYVFIGMSDISQYCPWAGHMDVHIYVYILAYIHTYVC